MIDPSVFSLTADTSLPPNKITGILNALRQGVNKQYYASFSSKQQEFFQYFVWEVLHGLWARHPSPTVRISASTTVGHILMKLAPYFADQFLASLTDTIEKTTNDSFLYLTSFCYLAKFTSIEKLSNILNNKPILHLFGANNSEHLPDLAVEMKKCLNFPREFLRTVVELTLQLTYNNPTNRHFPKAASILIGDDVDEYASLIRSDISILLLDNLFPQKLPIFPPGQKETLMSIKDRSIAELLNENPQLSSYEASCKILSKLLISNQIENLTQEIKETITEEIVERSPNLPALLLLPINPDIIRKMYTTQPVDDQLPGINASSSNFNLNLNSNSTLNLTSTLNINSTTNFDSRSLYSSSDFSNSTNNLILENRDKRLFSALVECDKSKIIPLLTYFSSSVPNIRAFFDELVSMIFNNLNTGSDAYSFALETLGKVSGNLPDYVMVGLFSKALSTAVSSNNWIHKWWTLRMIGKINFTHLPSRMSYRAFDFIDLAVVSKSEKLKQTAKKVSVKLIDRCKHEEFKYFIDRFCRKFDLFDQVTFESRVSYLSYVFQHIPQNWTISFIHIATLLTEAIGLIKFSMSVMREIFIIIGVLSNNLDESLVLLFAKQAQLIIDPSFREFCGEYIGIGQPPIFDRENTTANPLVFKTNSNYSSNLLINNLYNASFTNSADNSINYIKNIGKSVLVATFDTDLTSNPSLWHNDPLSYAEAAFGMLSKVQWSRFNLLYNDTIYFFNLATRMIELFPDFSNALAASLIEAPNINFYNVDTYIKRSIVISALHDDALFSFCKLISLVTERFTPSNNNLKLNEEKESPPFSLSNEKYNSAAIVSTISLVFPIMRDVDFLNVLCVQNFMSLMNADISNEVCQSVVKSSQKHLIGSSSKNINDMNSTSSMNIDQDVIIDPSLLYAENDDENGDNQAESHLKPTEFESFNDDINGSSPLANDFGFLNCCSSLTPFYYLNVEIPDELFRQEIIFSFALHSTVKITTEQADRLIEYTLRRASPRVLYFVLRYCYRMDVSIDLTERLSHPYFISKRVFLAVLPFLKPRKLPNDYITSVVGTDDLVTFVLSATTVLNRRASIAIIKFDPKYFMDKFMLIEKIKYDQLYNLVLYTCAVSFPADDFFSFAVKIMNMCSKSRKKMNLSRRLLSVFIGSNKTNKEIVINANSLLACEIFPLSSSTEIKTFTAAQIIEYYYEIATISKTADCSSVIEILSNVLSKNTIYGALLNMIIHPQMTFENIQGMISSPFASLQTLPFHFYDDKLKYDPDFSDLSSQIIDYLLQTTVIRTAQTSSTILSFLTRFLDFKNLSRPQMKVAFYFMHRNVDISPQCAALREVMMVYRSFLRFFYQKTEELKVVVEFADKLFDYPIVPTGSISILNQVSYILHDPSHVAVILTPYLKMKNSYSMCIVCENAATYLLRVKMNKIEHHSEQVSQLKEQSQQQDLIQQSQQQSSQTLPPSPKQLPLTQSAQNPKQQPPQQNAEQPPSPKQPKQQQQPQPQQNPKQQQQSQQQQNPKQQQQQPQQQQNPKQQQQQPQQQQNPKQQQQQPQQQNPKQQQQPQQNLKQQQQSQQQQQNPKRPLSPRQPKPQQPQQQQQYPKQPQQQKDVKQQQKEWRQQQKELRQKEKEKKQKEKEQKQKEKLLKKQQQQQQQLQRQQQQQFQLQQQQKQRELQDQQNSKPNLQFQHIQSQQSFQSNLPLVNEGLNSSSCYDESVDVIDDAVHVVSIARSFYATFNAIVSVENIRPTMKHDLLKGLFSPIYDYSLKILDDPDVKIFAPVLALLDESTEIPQELVKYIDAAKEILQKRKE